MFATLLNTRQLYSSISLHAVRLVALLQAAAREELERVDVLAEVDLGVLRRAHAEGGHVVRVDVDALKGDLLAHHVHHQLAVQREACVTDTTSRMRTRHVTFLHLVAARF